MMGIQLMAIGIHNEEDTYAFNETIVSGSIKSEWH